MKEATLWIAPTCNNWPFSMITERMFCNDFAGRTGSTCRGDSGGPIFKQENDVYILIGLVSWGHVDCNSNLYPDVWAAIAPVYDWIQHHMLHSDVPLYIGDDPSHSSGSKTHYSLVVLWCVVCIHTLLALLK